MGENKKQHYVSQKYLERFNLKVINLFDKDKEEVRKKQSIRGIACENYFYDFNEKERVALENDFPNLSTKFIEKLFSDILEPNLTTQLDLIENSIFNRVDTHRIVYSIEIKQNIILQIVYQIFRTKAFREHFCKYSLLPPDYDDIDSKALLQKRVLLDINIVNKWVEKLMEMKFLVHYNKTELDYFTSDNPVVLLNNNDATVSSETRDLHNFTSLFYPISRKVMIHITNIIEFNNIDDSFDNVDDETVFSINYANSLQLRNAFRYVFFNTDEINKDVFNMVNNNNYYTEDDIYEVDRLIDQMIEIIKEGNSNENDYAEITKEIQGLKEKYHIN